MSNGIPTPPPGFRQPRKVRRDDDVMLPDIPPLPEGFRQPRPTVAYQGRQLLPTITAPPEEAAVAGLMQPSPPPASPGRMEPFSGPTAADVRAQLQQRPQPGPGGLPYAQIGAAPTVSPTATPAAPGAPAEAPYYLEQADPLGPHRNVESLDIDDPSNAYYWMEILKAVKRQYPGVRGNQQLLGTMARERAAEAGWQVKGAEQTAPEYYAAPKPDIATTLNQIAVGELTEREMNLPEGEWSKAWHDAKKAYAGSLLGLLTLPEHVRREQEKEPAAGGVGGHIASFLTGLADYVPAMVTGPGAPAVLTFVVGGHAAQAGQAEYD